MGETTDTVAILYKRYFEGKPEMLTALERAKAEGDGEVSGYQQALREVKDWVEAQKKEWHKTMKRGTEYPWTPTIEADALDAKLKEMMAKEV